MRNMGLADSGDAGQAGKIPNYARASRQMTGQKEELVIDVTFLETNSLRSPFFNTILPQNLTERDQSGNSRPPRKFAVLIKDANGQSANYKWYDGTSDNSTVYLDIYSKIVANEGTGSYTCPPGYRMPNHSELLLMHAFNSKNSWGGSEFVFPSDGTTTNIYIAKSRFSYRELQPYVNAPYGNPRPGFGVTFLNGQYNVSLLNFFWATRKSFVSAA